MKKLLLTLLSAQFTVYTVAQDPTFEWVKAIEVLGASYGASACESMKIDGQGNLISTGYFRGTSDFDPGPGISELGSIAGLIGYVQKLDVNGNFLWAVKIGGDSAMIRPRSVALDASGNIYCTGSFNDTIDFDPGIGTANLVSAGFYDAFVLKLNPDGTFAWVKQIGGIGRVECWSIAVDAVGVISLVGTFQGTADFDPGTGVSTLTSTGFSDMFVAALDANGDLLWAKQMGSADPLLGMDGEKEHRLDDSGNMLITGWFRYTIDFDPGPATFNLTASGNTDMFILKLSPIGDLIWAKRVGQQLVSGDVNVLGLGISSDAAENVYIIGYFDGRTDFDPGSGVSPLLTTSQDIFVLKLTSNGDFVWVKRVAGSGDDWGMAIATTANGDSYITGGFEGTADFDMGAGVFNMTAEGNARDVFVQKIDTDGNLVWAFRFGSVLNDDGRAIEVDGSGNVYTMGFYIDALNFTTQYIDFDPGAGTFLLGSSSDDPRGFFIHKVSDPGMTVSMLENDNGETMVVHPNPANGDIRVTLDGIQNPMALNIYEVTGKLVHTQRLISNSPIDCQLPRSAGLYLVQIVKEDGTTAQMKVVNR
ncbi:MAG TPA: T9SS type A sorting domain-containing protein [Flavobacteriales bacterium]|nr:T9SS type A sorting domain-containing protein [Flavobacteriales bacterium]